MAVPTLKAMLMPPIAMSVFPGATWSPRLAFSAPKQPPVNAMHATTRRILRDGAMGRMTNGGQWPDDGIPELPVGDSFTAIPDADQPG